MMKKVWLILLAVVLVFGLAMLGCGSKSSGGGGDFVPFEWDTAKKGPVPLTVWGSNEPEYDDTTGTLSINASSSTGFYFLFSDLGYKLNRSDTFIFTYEVDVKTPVAIVAVKSVKNGQFDGDSDYGIGNGREYPLGHDKYSVYDGPKVVGTWDAATKTGTFEVLMKFMKKDADAIGFQHNYWADFHDGLGTVAEESEYTLKITKIQNKKGEDVPDTVEPPPGDDTAEFSVTIGGVPQATTIHAGTDGTGVTAIENGYKFNYGTVGYGNGIARFMVTLPAGKKLTDYGSVTFTWQGIDGGAASYKRLYLLASATEAAITPWKSDDDVKALVVSSNNPGGFYDGDGPQVNGTDEVPVTLPILKGDELTGDVWFAIYMHADGGVYSISNVTFKDKATISSIAVKTPPTNTIYQRDVTPFNPNGLVITATYSDGTTQDITYAHDAGFTFKLGSTDLTPETSKFPADGEAVAVTVGYQGKTATFNVTVQEDAPPAVVSFTIKTQPTKTTYKYKVDKFDPAGLEITATYDKGTPSTKDIAYNADDFTFKAGATDLVVGTSTFTAAGTTTITVTYATKTANFNVTVSAALTGVIWELDSAFLTSVASHGNGWWESLPLEYNDYGQKDNVVVDTTNVTITTPTRTAAYHGFDFYFNDKVDPNDGTGTFKGLGLDVSIYKVKITVEGSIVGSAPAGEVFIIQESDSPYDKLVGKTDEGAITDGTLTGAANETFSYAVDIPASFAAFLNGAGKLRIQTSGTASFTLSTVKVEITGEW